MHKARFAEYPIIAVMKSVETLPCVDARPAGRFC